MVRAYLSAVVVVFLSCGGPPETVSCGPANCSGCCLNDVCQDGLISSACGRGGGACDTCGTGETCDATQTCVTVCGPGNCPGCCFNNTCQAGTAGTACGKNGAACTNCAAGDVCDSTQTCVIDPQSHWSVVPKSAQAASTNNGGTWNVGGGAPDLYVDLFCPATATSITGSTAYVQDSFTPTWSGLSSPCIMTLSDLQSTGFKIAIYDDDATSDDLICSGTIKPISDAFAAGHTDLNCQGSINNLRVDLIRQ